MSDSKEIIKESLADRISGDLDKIFPPKDMKQLLTTTINLIAKVENLRDKWQKAQIAQERIMTQEGKSTNSKTGVAYGALYSQKQNILKYEEIQEIIIEAEIFLEKVRIYFTGQEIKYAVGVNYYGKLYEYNLTLLDLLRNAVLNIDSKTQGLKMKLAKSKSALISAYGTLDTQTRTVTVDDSNILEGNSELYESIHNYYTNIMDKKIINDNNKEVSVNEGEIYETYRYFIANNRTNFNPKKAKDIEFLNKAILRSMNSTSGRQGGDVDNFQVKFFNASFSTVSNILNTLRSLKEELELFEKSGKKKDFKIGIKKLFTKNQKDIEKIDADGQKEAKKNIDKVINSIPGFEVKK